MLLEALVRVGIGMPLADARGSVGVRSSRGWRMVGEGVFPMTEGCDPWASWDWFWDFAGGKGWGDGGVFGMMRGVGFFWVGFCCVLVGIVRWV